MQTQAYVTARLDGVCGGSKDTNPTDPIMHIPCIAVLTRSQSQSQSSTGLQTACKFTNCCTFRPRGPFLRELQIQSSTSTKKSILEVQCQILRFWPGTFHTYYKYDSSAVMLYLPFSTFYKFNILKNLNTWYYASQIDALVLVLCI
jgi:hypothetical protein